MDLVGRSSSTGVSRSCTHNCSRYYRSLGIVGLIAVGVTLVTGNDLLQAPVRHAFAFGSLRPIDVSSLSPQHSDDLSLFGTVFYTIPETQPYNRSQDDGKLFCTPLFDFVDSMCPPHKLYYHSTPATNGGDNDTAPSQMLLSEYRSSAWLSRNRAKSGAKNNENEGSEFGKERAGSSTLWWGPLSPSVSWGHAALHQSPRYCLEDVSWLSSFGSSFGPTARKRVSLRLTKDNSRKESKNTRVSETNDEGAGKGERNSSKYNNDMDNKVSSDATDSVLYSTEIPPIALVFAHRQRHRHDVALMVRRNPNPNVLVLEVGCNRKDTVACALVVEALTLMSSHCIRCLHPTVFLHRPAESKKYPSLDSRVTISAYTSGMGGAVVMPLTFSEAKIHRMRSAQQEATARRWVVGLEKAVKKMRRRERRRSKRAARPPHGEEKEEPIYSTTTTKQKAIWTPRRKPFDSLRPPRFAYNLTHALERDGAGAFNTNSSLLLSQATVVAPLPGLGLQPLVSALWGAFASALSASGIDPRRYIGPDANEALSDLERAKQLLDTVLANLGDADVIHGMASANNPLNHSNPAARESEKDEGLFMGKSVLEGGAPKGADSVSSGVPAGATEITTGNSEIAPFFANRLRAAYYSLANGQSSSPTGGATRYENDFPLPHYLPIGTDEQRKLTAHRPLSTLILYNLTVQYMLSAEGSSVLYSAGGLGPRIRPRHSSSDEGASLRNSSDPRTYDPVSGRGLALLETCLVAPHNPEVDDIVDAAGVERVLRAKTEQQEATGAAEFAYDGSAVSTPSNKASESSQPSRRLAMKALQVLRREHDAIFPGFETEDREGIFGGFARLLISRDRKKFSLFPLHIPYSAELLGLVVCACMYRMKRRAREVTNIQKELRSI